MKKTILLLILTILLLIFFLSLTTISCSSRDDDINQPNNFINPPDWIIGTWLDETEPVWNQIGGFKFTNDNLISIASNGDISSNLKEELKDGVNAGVIKTNEVITNTTYKLEIVSSGTVTNSFEFTKGTNNLSIIYDLSVTQDVILTKQ